MKKALIIVAFISFLILPVFAASSKNIVLECSYVVAGTDIYYKLEPLTINKDGNLILKNKIVGKVVENDNENIWVALADGGIFSLDKKKLLSIYTRPLDKDVINSYGTCVMK
ncbi:MAG: hypothetical protein Q4E83_03845 [bacterium]|nr:hypothetical protein [bacterium]